VTPFCLPTQISPSTHGLAKFNSYQSLSHRTTLPTTRHGKTFGRQQCRGEGEPRCAHWARCRTTEASHVPRSRHRSLQPDQVRTSHTLKLNKILTLYRAMHLADLITEMNGMPLDTLGVTTTNIRRLLWLHVGSLLVEILTAKWQPHPSLACLWLHAFRPLLRFLRWQGSPVEEEVFFDGTRA
jgi:hypothetical protein